jgi:hypothetical protein
MNDTALQTSPITLDRRLKVGDIDYQVTAFPTDDNRIDLCIVSSDGDGQVVSEMSGGLAPADLVGLTDVLISTLTGLIALTRPPFSARAAPPAEPQSHHPNQGARWSAADDELLVTRFREGARPRELMTELGRSGGGIRARLELLGELAPGARWRPPSEAGPPEAPPPGAEPPATPPGPARSPAVGPPAAPVALPAPTTGAAPAPAAGSAGRAGGLPAPGERGHPAA